MENHIHDMSNKESVYSKKNSSPIYDTSIEGSTNLDAWENLSMEEEHLEFSHDHSEPYHVEPHKGISNEDIEKQCYEKTYMMQSVEFPYDLEPLGAYTISYHPVSLDDQYDGVVNFPHITICTSTLSSHG